MKKFNPYRNIFYYFRGAHSSDRLADKQIEDNTTKALINTLEFSEIQLLHYFLESLELPFNKKETPFYDLQVAELLSRPDAQIKLGKLDFYIESKVQAALDETQINNHLNSIEKAFLIIITKKDSDLSTIKKINNPQLSFITWKNIYLLFSNYLINRKKEGDSFILRQFLKYLESINMAPFNGFQKEDFDSFLYVEDDPKKEIRSIVKNKLKKYLEEIQEAIKPIPSYKGLKIEVGNLGKNSHSVWGTLSIELKSKVDVPHFNFALNRNTFSIGFIVEGKTPAEKFYKNIEHNPNLFLKALNRLENFEIELQNRVFIRPRKYDNQTVATLKCGKEITKNDVDYIIKKAGEYKLILTWCRITIQRDDPSLNSKEFIQTSIKLLNSLKSLYEFSLSK